MTAQARLHWDQYATSPSPASFMFSERLGGYSFGAKTGVLDTDLLAEATLKFFGLVMILTAGAQWLVPASVFNGDPLLMKLGMTASFGLIGLGLYWHANHGFRSEVQIDPVNREVRLATRNSREAAFVRRRIAMRDIESCFLRRSKNPGTPAQLCIRIRGVAEPLVLITAPEGELEGLHDRLSRDLRSPHQRVAARVL